MKANELRIGNWLIDYENKIGKVKSIEDNNVLKVVSNEGVLISYCEIELYKPIPLTEEILLKCWFYYVGDLFDCHVYRLGIINVSCLNGVFTFSLKRDRKSNYVPLKEMEYVHQLQNLYFALTGEELNIEL